MAITIQLKRGTSDAWRDLNPVLAVAEPGYEKDTGKMKIGDGNTPWNDLQYFDQDNKEFYNAETVNDFPKEGKTDVLYKASQTAKLYQWNPTLEEYELLTSSGSGNLDDINLIIGGNAHGND